MADRRERSGFVFVRTPLLPWSVVRDWPADEAAARAWLGQLLSRPDVAEALLLGAPELVDQLETWRSGPMTEHGQRIEQALVRYVSRMTARATPLGAFAAVGPATFGDQTRLRLAGAAELRRHTRVAMRLLVNLVAVFSRDPEVRAAVEWWPNPTLTSGPAAEFVVTSSDRERVTHHVQQVDVSGPLAVLLERAQRGARLEDLAKVLVDDDVSLDDARAFVDEVAAAQVLVSELQVPVTGTNPEQVVLETLTARGLTAQATTLRSLISEVEALSGQPPGVVERARIDAITRTGGALLSPGFVKASQDVMSVDLERPAADFMLPASVVKELETTVAWLQDLVPLPPPLLQPMVDAFVERFEAREVPLLEALDPVRGLPAAREPSPPMVAAVPLGFSSDKRELGEPPTPPWLLDAWVAAVRAGHRELVLDPPAASTAVLPDAWSLWFRLDAKDEAAVARGEWRAVLQGAGPPYSGFARFGRTLSDLPAKVAALVAREESRHPDVLFAEVVHLPSGYSDNVVTRPAWRRYEIPVVGRSSLPLDQQLPLRDLLVSVRQGRFQLRSRRLGRVVQPVAATAFNYEVARESRAFRFLSGLTDVRVRTQLPLGDLLRASWSPRLRVGRIVLSPERWRLTDAQREQGRRSKGVARREWVARLRQTLGWPRFVTAGAEGQDNHLIVDLDNPLLVDSFAHLAVTQGAPVVVRELFVGEGTPIHCAEGPLLHEVVVPFLRGSTDAPSGSPPAPVVEVPLAQRVFSPTTEWGFLKCYGAIDAQRRFLLGPARQRLEAAFQQGSIDGWFFLHYADPQPHLRVRVHGPQANPVMAALLSDAKPWVDESFSKVEWSTYAREVERYGGLEGVALAERVFCADSVFALEVLGDLRADDEAVLILLAATHRLFDDFQVPLEPRAQLVAALRAGYAAEFGVAQSAEAALSELGRSTRQAVAHLLAGQGELAERLKAPLDRRSALVTPVVSLWRALVDSGRSQKPLSEVVASLVHMQAPRLTPYSQRKTELVVLDLLDRQYRSTLARQRPPRS